MLRLYEAIGSTLLDRLRCTGSNSQTYVSSGFILASLPPTAAAPNFQSYRIYLAVKQWMLSKWSQTDRQWQHRDGILIQFTTDRLVVPTNDLRIVSCGCIILKTCGCRKAWLYRSPMCSHCNGHPCSNTPSLPGIRSLEDDP